MLKALVSSSLLLFAPAVANLTGSSDLANRVVAIHPGDDIAVLVDANPPDTRFEIYPGTYRLERTIEAKTGDTFIGQTPCAPPKTACQAVLSGSRNIGPRATFDGTNYKVTGQMQAGPVNVTTRQCQPGWAGCIYPEDLFFDAVPLQHLNSPSLPAMSKGQWWFDYANHVIYFHDNPAGHLVETSAVTSAFGGTGNHVTISQLRIEQFASPLGAPGTIGMPGNASLTEGIDWTIKNCEIRLNHGKAVRVAFGMQILENYIHDNGYIGIGGGTATNSITQSTPSRIVITDNLITHNNYAHALPDYESGGIKINVTRGVVIRGNTITHNDGSGIHFDTSSQSPLVDGNIVTDNTGGDGIAYEISVTSATFRNNILLRNGANTPTEDSANAALASAASVGVDAYCNVIEIPNAAHANGLMVIGSERGRNLYAPGEYLASRDNTFHHNTVIWDAGAQGAVGYFLHDAAHQPQFFEDNPPPDYNAYHLNRLSDADFVYDHNNSQQNARKTFVEYRAAGADVHSTADTKHASGYPLVKITSPEDQSSFTGSTDISAKASDQSGIDRVEFYVDWQLRATVKNLPYGYNWTDGYRGTHTVAAMAYSNAGIRACYAVTLNKK